MTLIDLLSMTPHKVRGAKLVHGRSMSGCKDKDDNTGNHGGKRTAEHRQQSMLRAMQLVAQSPSTAYEAAEKLSMSSNYVRKLLAEMEDKGLLVSTEEKVGCVRRKRYSVAKHQCKEK